MILKVSRPCYAIRLMVRISNINTLKSVHYAYFHSIMKYEIIFLGNSSNSGKIFTLQKQIIRMMAVAHSRTSCSSLLNRDSCQYIFSLMMFIFNNQVIFQIHLHTILIQGIHITFTDQMPNYLVFRKVHSVLAKKFSTVYHLLWQSSRMTTQN